MARDRSSGDATRLPQWLILVGVWLAASIAAVILCWTTGFWSSEPEPSPLVIDGGVPDSSTDPLAVTPVSSSRFKNTGAEASYVGSQACVECHPQEHESFRRTGMGRSMAEVDLSREPPDAAFDHPPSKRRYEVRRRDGQLWHRELAMTAAGESEIVLSEHPVKYVTGSGRHSLTYMAEIDGFLVESPITWYRSRDGWWMSPGYDVPQHSSFQREVGQGCLVCHAGQSEALDRSLHRMRIIEATIGCERCHGPGSLHVALRTDASAAAPAAGEVDETIVNPAHLSRELAEAVCQQCHLRASAIVLARGKRHSDFRPGLPLEDFRHDYALEVPDKPMTVVGHVEQMHLSLCYQRSETFTCVTCHDPHGEPPAEERVAYYRQACLKCHDAEHCTVDPQRRRQESADNNCVHCHMPSTPTDIPHLAFTHHRVGIHAAAAGGEGGKSEAAPGVLKPFLDLSRLTEIERTRSLGLAYLDLAIHEENPDHRLHYQRQALSLLSEVESAGLKEGDVNSALATLRFDLGLGGYFELAQNGLADPELEGLPRCNALFLVADWQYRQGRYVEAVATLETLNGLRRNSLQWLLKAECEQKLGNEVAMLEALEAAVRVRPGQSKIHARLAEIYRARGDTSRAKWHALRAAAFPE
jgi:hypothetical protein